MGLGLFAGTVMHNLLFRIIAFKRFAHFGIPSQLLVLPCSIYTLSFVSSKLPKIQVSSYLRYSVFEVLFKLLSYPRWPRHTFMKPWSERTLSVWAGISIANKATATTTASNSSSFVEEDPVLREDILLSSQFAISEAHMFDRLNCNMYQESMTTLNYVLYQLTRLCT